MRTDREKVSNFFFGYREGKSHSTYYCTTKKYFSKNCLTFFSCAKAVDISTEPCLLVAPPSLSLLPPFTTESGELLQLRLHLDPALHVAALHAASGVAAVGGWQAGRFNLGLWAFSKGRIIQTQDVIQDVC